MTEHRLVRIKRPWVPNWLFAILARPIDFIRLRWLPFRHLLTEEVARCRWCDNNAVPVSRMAIYSWKDSYGGFTGVCRACFYDSKVHARYIEKFRSDDQV